MNLLTPTGYKNIEDVNIGDELIAYDINTGDVIINTLLKKELWTHDMLPENPQTYQSVYNEETQEYEEVLIYSGMSSEQVFQETHGDWKFYEINGTWKLYKNQSIWSNMKVVHSKDLQVGDVIYDDDDNDVEITSIVECTETSWWRLEVSNDHSYISDNLQLHNASRYWQKQNASFNWNATGPTNWGSASGVSDNASVPTSVDDVFFDGVGANGNIDSTISAAITVLSINVQSGYTATITFLNSLTISGNITLTNNFIMTGNGSLLTSGTATITTNGKLINIVFGHSVSTSTKTLVGNLEVTGEYRLITNGITATYVGAELILHNLFQTTSTGNITGIIRIKGGTINVTNSRLNGVILDGDIVLTGFYVEGSLTYQSGTITGVRNIIIPANATLNTNGMSFGGITVFNNITVTLNSLLTVTGTLTLSFISIFNGTAGFTVGTLSKIQSTTINTPLTLQNSVTYTITNSFLIRNNNSSTSISSNDATLRANLILVNGATCNVSCNFTRIDATGGRTINSWNGTITDCLNVRSFTDFQGIANNI
jgi:hypothetical protein